MLKKLSILAIILMCAVLLSGCCCCGWSDWSTYGPPYHLPGEKIKGYPMISVNVTVVPIRAPTATAIPEHIPVLP